MMITETKTGKHVMRIQRFLEVLVSDIQTPWLLRV